MANAATVFNIIATVLGLIAVALGLYVTLRLYQFKDELIKQINGTYVRSPIFDAHVEYEREARERIDGEIKRLRDRVESL